MRAHSASLTDDLACSCPQPITRRKAVLGALNERIVTRVTYVRAILIRADLRFQTEGIDPLPSDCHTASYIQPRAHQAISTPLDGSWTIAYN